MMRLTVTAGGRPLPKASAGGWMSLTMMATRVFDLFAGWAERAAQRRMLAGASDHILHDIGISRADVEQEIEKPFWRK